MLGARGFVPVNRRTGAAPAPRSPQRQAPVPVPLPGPACGRLDRRSVPRSWVRGARCGRRSTGRRETNGREKTPSGRLLLNACCFPMTHFRTTVISKGGFHSSPPIRSARAKAPLENSSRSPPGSGRPAEPGGSQHLPQLRKPPCPARPPDNRQTALCATEARRQGNRGQKPTAPRSPTPPPALLPWEAQAAFSFTRDIA